MDRPWAQVPLKREQALLFGQTLDEAVAREHPIRVLDVLLHQLDWQEWEARYAGRRGQPPIHPRMLRKRPVNGIFPNPCGCGTISPLQEAHGNGGYRWNEPG